MTDLDLTRYEGHTEGPWEAEPPVHVQGGMAIRAGAREIAGVALDDLLAGRANARLIADAPLLLAEVRRLREAIRVQANAASRAGVRGLHA